MAGEAVGGKEGRACPACVRWACEVQFRERVAAANEVAGLLGEHDADCWVDGVFGAGAAGAEAACE